MRNLIDVLRSEITRLARKEVKGQITPLREASVKYRREIAHLKKVTKDLERRLAFMEAQERKRVRKPPSAKLADGARFSATRLKAHRTKLGLSAADYGQLVGVSAQTIYAYERGKARPRKSQLAKLVAVRGLGKREAQRRLALLKE